MAKNENQKLKLYYLYRIMLEKTDDEHGITMPEIIKELERRGITAERKGIYRDFDVLTDEMGIEIIGEKSGRQYFYHVGAKQFELAELKLLVDAVQSSKFITERKSSALIKKITGFASQYEAGQLKRQVHVQGRIKTMNESIYYNVDEIHNAIAENSRIRFKYLQWDVNGKLVPKCVEGTDEVRIYEVSPWALSWDDENYYMIAFDHLSSRIRHYRVDKMDRISLTNEPREGKEQFADFDPAKYAKKSFGMFAGEERKVRIEFPAGLAGVFIDRFGKDIPIHPAPASGTKKGASGISESARYVTTVDVAVSSQFFGWIFALGPDVTVAGPDDVAAEYKAALNETLKKYK